MSYLQQDWFATVDVSAYTQLAKELVGDHVPETAPVALPVGSPQLDVRCGPIVRFCGMLEGGRNNYRALVMIVTANEKLDYLTKPKLDFMVGPELHTTEGAKMFPGQVEAISYYEESGFTFWRFELELEVQAYAQKVRYGINTHHLQQHEWYVPSLLQLMNVMLYLCNGFSLATPAHEFKGHMWLDVLRHHAQLPFHVMVGGGDQIYCDAVKLESELLKQWTEEQNHHQKKHSQATPELLAELKSFYLHHYIKWFGSGFWKGTNGRTLQLTFPVALLLIPSVNIYDDHDIIDGFGSYKDSTMLNPVFNAVGNQAYVYYMLFQHHMLPEEKVHNSEEAEPLWILSKAKGPYIRQQLHSNYMRLGRGIGLLGLDCRTERKHNQVVTEELYRLAFARLQREVDAAKGDIKHMLILLGVPIAYPRLVWLEKLLLSPVLVPIKKLLQKGIIAKGLVNEFDGSVEVLDDLDDHWCAKHHKHERNEFVLRMMHFGAKNGVRVSILAGDVHLCCVGRFKLKIHLLAHVVHAEEHREKLESVVEHPEKDVRLIFNITLSAIVNTPPPNGMATLLNKRSKLHHFDHATQEDVIPMFKTDVKGELRANNMFMNRRNWCGIVPAANSAMASHATPTPVSKDTVWRVPGVVDENNPAAGNLSLATTDVKNPNPPYPLTQDSLVVQLHVEKDQADVEAATAVYELIVPELTEKEELQNVGIKKLLRR